MTYDATQPFDFSPLDDMYLMSDEYIEKLGRTYELLQEIERKAWVDAETQSASARQEYIQKYVIAQWRTLEREYLEESAMRGSRLPPFRRKIILGRLIIGREMEGNFRAIVSELTRDELLMIVSRVSAPWCRKYNVRLAYDSEIDYFKNAWDIFVDAQTD